jgi:hypothetical protein
VPTTHLLDTGCLDVAGRLLRAVDEGPEPAILHDPPASTEQADEDGDTGRDIDGGERRHGHIHCRGCTDK